MNASELLFRSTGTTSLTSTRLADLVAQRPVDLDERALAARMLLAPPFRHEETPYRFVSATRAAPELEPEPSEGAAPSSIAEAVAITRAALEAAVARAFGSAKRVAVLAGGGLDSSALLALAVAHARRIGGTAFGVALDFEGPGDDRPHLRALEAKLGCEILRVKPEESARRFALVRSGVDAAPFTWPGGAMEIELLAHAREHGAERAFTGAGADDLFDGEPRALAALLREGRLADAAARARRLRGFERPRAPLLTWLARPLVADLVPSRLRAWRSRRVRARVPAWASPLAREFVREARAAHVERIEATREGDARARTLARLGAPHLEHLAWLRHQESVGSGLERRDPYLEPALVAAITRLPPALLLHGDIRRGLFREAVADRLPDALRARLDKAAFEPAFARFVAASRALDVLREHASVPRLAALGLADPRLFREAFEAFAARPEDPEGAGWIDVWPALAVESFLAAR